MINVKAIVTNPKMPDLTLRQIAVLVVLTETGEHTVGSISEGLKLNKPSVTRSLQRLEKFDFVKRAPHPDKRVRDYISPTKAGRQYLTRLAA